ncbi:hypothetical protein E2C01_008863 [Portunus trituberculatus]|uniref:Uncharacterized protein n=1 Tax=Portunus trituberculatus TaxID=210409 RepID=A0A5B7D421_PORTR|nr:hypothetical protein [Portunus trituberculatus]
MPTSLETAAPSEEAQPTLGPSTGFEPVCLETPRTPKHAWFHSTTLPRLTIAGYHLRGDGSPHAQTRQAAAQHSLLRRACQDTLGHHAALPHSSYLTQHHLEALPSVKLTLESPYHHHEAPPSVTFTTSTVTLTPP